MGQDGFVYVLELGALFARAMRQRVCNNDYPVVSETANMLHHCVGFSVTHTPSFGCSVAVSFGVAVWPVAVMR